MELPKNLNKAMNATMYRITLRKIKLGFSGKIESLSESELGKSCDNPPVSVTTATKIKLLNIQTSTAIDLKNAK